MAEHPHVQVALRMWQALSVGDTDGVAETVAADCVFYVPGDHPFAGEHKGRDTLLHLYRQMQEATDATLRDEARQGLLHGRGHVMPVGRTTPETAGMPPA